MIFQALKLRSTKLKPNIELDLLSQYQIVHLTANFDWEINAPILLYSFPSILYYFLNLYYDLLLTNQTVVKADFFLMHIYILQL